MVGDKACELELPEAMKTHPVMNLSQVKKCHGSLQWPLPIKIHGEEKLRGFRTTDDQTEATSIWYFGQVMMSLITSGYLSKIVVLRRVIE